MRIGIDFDNTLACYDKVFSTLAQNWGLIEAGRRITKQEVRQLVRRKESGELLWQRFQGEVYGPRMPEAEQFSGEDHFLLRCATTPDVQVYIVSHKTEHGHFDNTHTNLRDVARLWMRNKGFFSLEKYDIPEQHVFFECSQQEKVARIALLECDVFIDDLPELFAIPSFPTRTRKILFAEEPSDCADSVCASWAQIEAVVFGD